MKLKDWADRQGIAYLTAWRWFKAGDPRLANAYQSSSGTIIVPDETDFLEQPMAGNNQATDVMSLFLKKTVEYSKNNSSIEDFAAYILSTFSLKINHGSESPKYSKNKPKSEDIQKHFQQFIKPKGEKPKANMFVAEPAALDELVAKADTLTAQELVNEIKKCGDEITPPQLSDPEISDLLKDINAPISNASLLTNNAEGLVSRTVDLSTPQQINYTSSTDQPLGTFSYSNLNVNASGALPMHGSTFVTNTMPQGVFSGTLTANNSGMIDGVAVNSLFTGAYYNPENLTLSEDEDEGSADLWTATKFKPTQKELTSATKVFESAVPTAARRRGRKPKAKP
jgi:hypothetical protein